MIPSASETLIANELLNSMATFHLSTNDILTVDSPCPPRLQEYMDSLSEEHQAAMLRSLADAMADVAQTLAVDAMNNYEDASDQEKGLFHTYIRLLELPRSPGGPWGP